jgi:hypothetical protein
MTVIPPGIEVKRGIEDRAIALGVRRQELAAEMTANTQGIIDLLRDAEGAGIPYEHLSQLLGVSRQTLFRWREVAARLKPGETTAQTAAR